VLSLASNHLLVTALSGTATLVRMLTTSDARGLRRDDSGSSEEASSFLADIERRERHGGQMQAMEMDLGRPASATDPSSSPSSSSSLRNSNSATGKANDTHERVSIGRILKDVITAPLNVAKYYRRLTEAFGWRFVAIVSIVYGLNQGMGEAFFEFGGQYLLSDEPPDGYGLNANRMESISGFANVPWQIKSVYGILSDSFPIVGYHRSPYVVIAGIFGVLSWGALWLVPLSLGMVATMLFLGNLSVASPDVMIDASVAERCRTHPNFASDLQTLCWASFGLGKIFASSTMGVILATFGSRSMFGLTSLTSIAMLLPAIFNWLTEEPRSTERLLSEVRIPSSSPSTEPSTMTRNEGIRVSEQDQRPENSLYHPTSQVSYASGYASVSAIEDIELSSQSDDTGTSRIYGQDTSDYSETAMAPHGCVGRLRHAFRDPLSGPIYYLSFIVMGISISMGFVAKQSEDYLVVFGAAILTTLAISIAVLRLEGKVSLRLAKASCYIFLANAIQPTSALLFLWSKRDERFCGDNESACPGKFCPRPCFSEEFIAMVDVVGYVVFVVGTSMYNKYLSLWPYRRIWRVTQIALTFVSLLDLVFVCRWNLAIGIPDKAFIMGDEILSDLIARLNTMPLFVLAAATCPPGVEATLFALNMGLSNFGGTLGKYHGLGLMWVFGGVTGPEFANLDYFVLVRSLMRLLPILLIPMLVPTGTPQTETFEEPTRAEEGEKN